MSEVAISIEKVPGVCGGEACLAGTRIPVWLLEQARRLGATEAQLMRSYPALSAAGLAEAWAYTEAHQSEVERAILDNETD